MGKRRGKEGERKGQGKRNMGERKKERGKGGDVDRDVNVDRDGNW